MTEKKKSPKKLHPWRVWVPKKDKPAEEVSKYDRIHQRHRMGVRM